MPKRIKKNYLINFIGLILLFFVLYAVFETGVFGTRTSYLKGIATTACYTIIMVTSLNLLVGIMGEFSLGHAGFMSVGAYASAVLTNELAQKGIADFPLFLIALLAGGIAAAITSVLVGIPTLKLRGDYLAIVTLAFGEIIKNIINAMYVGLDENGFHFSMKDSMSLNMTENGRIIIKGAQGITGTARQSNFTIGIILLLLTLVVVLNLMNSRSGRAIMSIRDNRIAAESVGIDITKYKIMAFAISASLAGLAGCLYAHNLSSLTALPKNFGYNMSIMILVYVVLGGMANMRGSIIAAVALTMIPELLRGIGEYRMLIYAIIMIVMMIFNWSPKVKEWREAHSLKGAFHKKNVKEAK